MAICWNYLVVVDEEGVTKYGLVNGKNGHHRLALPPGGAKIASLSATPRHLLVCTENGGTYLLKLQWSQKAKENDHRSS